MASVSEEVQNAQRKRATANAHAESHSKRRYVRTQPGTAPAAPAAGPPSLQPASHLAAPQGGSAATRTHRGRQTVHRRSRGAP